MSANPIDIKDLPEGFMDRFWSRVAIGGPDECWEWQRARTSAGYGATGYGNGTKMLYANRVALAWKLGGVLSGELLTRHTCDNPPCVNPAHLLPGTNSDNMLDRSLRGRHPQGRKASQSKLRESDIPRIWALKADGWTCPAIGAEFGVSGAAIWAVLHGKSWTHVKVSA